MSRKVPGDDPVFDRMADDVLKVRRLWPTTHSVAHRDETTGAVSFHLHVRPADKAKLHALLGDVPVREMRNGKVTSFHLHGRRADMDRLLQGLQS